MRDQKPIIINGENFDGLYARGVSGNSYQPDDACPINGFTKADEVRFTPWGLQARPGYDNLDLITTVGIILQVIPYHTNDTLTSSPNFGLPLDGYLVVTYDTSPGVGLEVTNVYDSNSPTPTVPIAVSPIAGLAALHVSLLCIYGSLIFSYHDYILGKFTYIIKPGQAAARQTGGQSPAIGTLGINFASSGTAGNAVQGLHVFGLAYVTDTGHITFILSEPGNPTNNADFFTLANANEQVTVTNLPSPLPSGMTKILFLASRVIQSSTGDAKDYALYFVPNAESDGSSATVTFDFTDESLIDSADYLYDLEPFLQGQMGFAFYSNRLFAWGETYPVVNPNALLHPVGPSTLRVSLPELIESFSSSTGFIQVFADDGSGGIRNCFEYQGLLIIQKENKTFVTRDNGGDPNTWGVDILDGTIGGVLNGVTRSLDTAGTTRNTFAAVISRSGLYLFDGKFVEIPLSWKIERIWQEISEHSDFIKYQIVDIPTAKLILVLVKSDANDTDRWFFLVCDYSRGMNTQTIRWSVWNLTDEMYWMAMNTPTTLWLIKKNATADGYEMIIGTEDSELFQDRGTDILSGELTTAELGSGDFGAEQFNRVHYLMVRAQGVFTQNNLTWINDDQSVVNFGSWPTIALNLSGDITQKAINFNSYFPRLRINFNSGADVFFRLKRLAIYGRPIAEDMVNV